MAPTPRSRRSSADTPADATPAPARRRTAGTSSTATTPSAQAAPANRTTRKSAAPAAAKGTTGAGGTASRTATAARTTDGPSEVTDSGPTPRQRARTETLQRILAIAHDRLVAGGADALSLRAVARELGMVSSAVYRYVASREDLLRLLAERAGTDLAGAVDAAVRSRRADPGKRLVAIARAVRTWGSEHPGDFGLLFGRVGTVAAGAGATADRPVPGTGALGLPAALLRLYVEDDGQGTAKIAPAARRELGVFGAALGVQAEPEAVARALFAWSAIAGAVAVEVSGQLSGVSGNAGALFDVGVERIAAATGLAG